ncbi:MAG TPA: thermonuclease family protein [Candidatus Saccharimonadales bacterium]|nr:thermonuclease family protein [Candidatus Saccharimonadales bacterium]
MKRLRKRQISLLLSVLALGVLLLGQHFGWFETAIDKAEQTQPGLYGIARFIDGDTIAVHMNGRQETVRMIGIDTPETHKPDTPVQCYGSAAAAFTKNLIGTQEVRLQADAKSQNRDRYDRLLRYVYLPDGRLVQKELISGGYGFAYTQFPFTKSDEFVAAEGSAKQAGKGLWSNCTVTAESNGRKQTNTAQ